MRLLFVNDVPIYLVEATEALEKSVAYDYFLETKNINFQAVEGHLFIKAKQQNIRSLVNLMVEQVHPQVESITLWIEDYKKTKKLIKGNFKGIKAAGGIVGKKNELLMIRRFNKWDLPKGKLNKKEKCAHAAVREVEEECGVKVKLRKKIGTTWHTYIKNKEKILKKTTWYAMTCIDDRHMRPQTEERIEKVVWIRQTELDEVLKEAYHSIKHVLQQYYNYLAGSIQGGLK